MPIYFHETIDPTPVAGKQEEYLAEIGKVSKRLAEAGPKAGLRCVGNWVTVWATGRWPQVIGLWEVRDWEWFTEHFDGGIAQLFTDAPQHYYDYRLGGFDRLLLPAQYTPTLDQIVERGIRAPVVLQEHIGVGPGRAGEYLEELGKAAAEIKDGIRLVGAYIVALRDGGEVLTMWGLEGFGAFAAIQQRPNENPAFHSWRRRSQELETSYIATLMCPTEWAMLR